MRPVGKPLGVTVHEDPRQGDRSQYETQTIEGAGRGDEDRARQVHGGGRLRKRQPARRELAPLGPRGQAVELAVDDPIEPHGRKPRRRERDDHEQDLAQGDRRQARGIHDAHQRKR